MSVVVIGLSHRTSPVEVREKFAFTEAEIPAAVAELRRRGLADEAVILSTCNRVELYLATPQPPAQVFPALHEFLVTHHAYPDPVHDHLYQWSEPQSVEHLFKVACGLDSMVLGETEILGQLKLAYDLALQHKLTGPRLNKAFQRAFNVAKHIRTTTNIQRGSISVASVAVELAERIFDTLAGHPVMVIGAGDTSEKTARALLSRGADSLVVTNRTREKAEALARELGGRAIGFDEWEREFARIDIAISSTSAPGYVIERARLEPLMKVRRHRPLLLIDIAVPRDVDPAVNEVDNVYLYNVDDLQSIANEYLQQRREEVARCEAIIREKVAGLLAERRIAA
ncbi:MAG: glutamyl-tRNA reductase [Limisphaerales bacterium]